MVGALLMRGFLVVVIGGGGGGGADALGAPLLLLASDAGSYLTGQTVYVEGGILAGSAW